MNTKTGEIVPMDIIIQMSVEEQKQYVEVKRDLTKLEEMNKKIKMYSPCGCGSGKKFKFCCHKS